MSVPTTISDVLARLHDIQATLPADDGVAVFNRVYLTVTERIGEIVADPRTDPDLFRDPRTLGELDVRFARLWLAAYDADAAGRTVPAPWRPLFEARAGGRLPIQYALAGINSHIEHDLPVAVVDTCQALGKEPDDLHRDYEAVNTVLAEVEGPIRRSFLDEFERRVDDHLGPVAHIVSAWKIDKARDVAWVTAETLWALRHTSWLQERVQDSVGHTVGLTSRALLITVP